MIFDPSRDSARKTLGLTQKELARRANVSERLWAEVERGERPNVSLETALRMLSEVGVSVRLNDPLGTSRELSDAQTIVAARVARAAVRRASWTGTQTTLAEEGVPPEVGDASCAARYARGGANWSQLFRVEPAAIPVRCRVPFQSTRPNRSRVVPSLPLGTTRACRRESPDVVPAA